MRAFWTFVRGNYPGDPDNPTNDPGFPEGLTTLRTTTPGDIVRLQTAFGHRHLMLGGFAIADDNLIGEVGEGHTHLVVKMNDTWHQVTRGATNHNHPLRLHGETILADWFLSFVACSDADAATIAVDPDCYPVVEAEMSQDEEGQWKVGDLDNTPWTAEEWTTWETRCLSILGFQLPDEVTNGKRLVKLFLGSLLSRQSGDERGYRLT